jgi:hypothetical protein
MGRYLPDLQTYFARFPPPIEALADAWADRTEALLDFAAGREDAVLYRFEDLLAHPEATLDPIFDLLGVGRMKLAEISAALAAPLRPGLGDWKTYGEAGLNPAPVGRWQKAISRRVAGQLMARLAPVMLRAGYEPVPVPRLPTRTEAIKQFGAAARLAARTGWGKE